VIVFHASSAEKECLVGHLPLLAIVGFTELDEMVAMNTFNPPQTILQRPASILDGRN